MTFADLLQLDVFGDVIAPVAAGGAASSVVLVIGDARAELAAPNRARTSDALWHVFVGLPLFSAPEPVLLGNVVTERGTTLDDWWAFAWLEENFMDQPRAVVSGLFPSGDEPTLFARDLDLDRPPEAFMRALGGWQRVAGVVVARRGAAGGPRVLRRDEAALCALDVALDSAPDFVDGLRADVSRGASLRTALKVRRKWASAALMRRCDGWRILSVCAPFLSLDPRQADAPDPLALLRP